MEVARSITRSQSAQADLAGAVYGCPQPGVLTPHPAACGRHPSPQPRSGGSAIVKMYS